MWGWCWHGGETETGNRGLSWDLHWMLVVMEMVGMMGMMLVWLVASMILMIFVSLFRWTMATCADYLSWCWQGG